jgi:hypothetical protein
MNKKQVALLQKIVAMQEITFKSRIKDLEVLEDEGLIFRH